MKKKVLIICLILVAILVLFLVYKELTKSPLQRSDALINSKYKTLLESAKEIDEYDVGDTFRLADGDDIKWGTAYSDGTPLKLNDLYVWHILGSNHDSILEGVYSNQIKTVLELKDIIAIRKEKYLIDYTGRAVRMYNEDIIWGIYYSFDSNPHSEFIFERNNLIKSGKGWKLKFNDGQSYYTEKLSGDFFYYEGIQLP